MDKFLRIFLDVIMWETYLLASAYVLTVKVGVCGNLWAIGTVLRNRRPYNNIMRMSPSDRLRIYISILAIIDLIVTLTLISRIIFISTSNLNFG